MKVLLTRALAILLIVVAHGFLLNVPNAASVALGVAYAFSVVMLGIAAWMLLKRTVDKTQQ